MRRSITDVLTRDGIEIPGAAGVFDTTIDVDIEFRAVPFDCSQTLVGTDQVKLSVALDRRIREGTGSIAPFTVARKSVYSNIQVLVRKRPAGIGANTTTIFGTIEG